MKEVTLPPVPRARLTHNEAQGLGLSSDAQHRSKAQYIGAHPWRVPSAVHGKKEVFSEVMG